MMDLTINTEREMNELLEFLHDGRLHQNVTDTLPKQFKEPKRSSPPAPNKVRPTMKRVYQMVDQDSNQSLQPMAKTLNYRDPNLSLIRAQNIKQQIMKGNIRPQFRVVPQKSPQNGLKVVNGRSSPSTESFVPYGKLYRTVLKNGKAIQTPVVNTTNDLKFKTNAWQKQRQLQVTQGTMALNGNDVSRNQILKFAVLRDARRNPSIQELREMGKLAAVASDENQNPNETEVKAEPVDEDEVAEVVEFGYSSPDDRPLSEVIRQRNTNSNNNRGNSSSEDEAMAIIDCSGNGNDLVTLDNGAEQVIDMAVNHKRERTPYSVLPRRHVCNICDKKFVRPAELERHYRIHTGEKPFKCNVCDQEFTRKCHLTKHMITHDNKQYYCTMCKFKTIRPDTFRRHLKDHNRGAEIGVCGDTELNQLAQDSTVEIVTEDQFDMNDGTERWNNMTYD